MSLALLALGSVLATGGENGARPAPAWIRVTPTTIELPGEAPRASENPIADALERAGPGSLVDLGPGDYPAFTIGFGRDTPANADTSGGLPGRPIVVRGSGTTRVVGQDDTIAIDQRRPNGYITFRDLTIVPGTRAGVIFYRQDGERAHVGYSFEDCDVLGDWDALRVTGTRSKWGVWGHSLSDFRFVGTRRPARVERLALEHAFYLQNQRGPITIENVHARELGRTFVQITARESEGPPARGDIVLRDCEVEDVGLAAGDDHKGGSAFTFAGRIQGTILVERCRYRAGFRAELRALTVGDAPYGTGALVAWQGGESEPNDTLILHDDRFEFAPGCGDRPVVSIGGCRRVSIVGECAFVSGGMQPALALDPVESDGRLTSPANGRVVLAPGARLAGRLTLRGREAKPEERAGLAGPAGKGVSGPDSEDSEFGARNRDS
jgi:hypothetical protein